ncbi:MAG: phosphoribosylamine--glycine ligase [Clostridia bacterium]|nr:phosphoribosylamine--glycine ligase [Clostridia bacterium]
MKKILVVGGGGREHAIATKLAGDGVELFAAPGNAGISQIATCLPYKATDIEGITAWAVENQPYMVMVAPDDPLAMGMVDELNKRGIRAFGPDKKAAEIEGSKAFAKDLMQKYGIPTADYKIFTDSASALEYVSGKDGKLVVKADGLALGKGVIICNNRDDSIAAVKSIMEEGAFGKAGSKVVIEEFLQGYEVSVMAFTDGKTVRPMPPAHDHKRALDGDEGLNTGGMGVYSPSPRFDDRLMQKAMKEIFLPTVQAMNSEGRTFKGVLYFGLMVDGDDIRVLEYNARFGDPETQAILPRLETPLVEIFDAIIDQRLGEVEVKWADGYTACVIVASGGYPLAYEKGKPIEIKNLNDGTIVFHSGTAYKDGVLVTNGGRVMGVTVTEKDLASAEKEVYSEIKKITFDKMFYRSDICK